MVIRLAYLQRSVRTLKTPTDVEPCVCLTILKDVSDSIGVNTPRELRVSIGDSLAIKQLSVNNCVFTCRTITTDEISVVG